MSSISKGTFQGYVSSTQDALLIFEAVRRGIMPKITRRLREDERGLIKSGTVFVFDERESGIKRWTDGLLWSPSRILLNFLVYRQIDRKSVRPSPDQPAFATSQPGFPLPSAPMEASSSSAAQGSSMRPFGAPQSGGLDDAGMVGPLVPYGGNATAGPSNSTSMGATYADGSGGVGLVPYGSQGGLQGQTAAGMVVPAASASTSLATRRDNELERSLVGSLTSSYPFLKDGLCKKTISIQVEGSTQHLISYYTVDDVRSGRLRTPSSLPEIAALCISPIFLNKSNFRNPPHIEYGPDGIPRYRGDASEGSSSRLLGHNSGSEGTSSGSDSRDNKSLHSPGSAMTLYSPSLLSDGSQSDPYFRHAHQIGGSGCLPVTATSGNMYNAASGHRKSSDAQLRRSTSRYEPYSVQHAHNNSVGSPYFSQASTPYYQSPVHPNTTAMSRKNSNASATARGWTNAGPSSSPGQAVTPLSFSTHALGGSSSLFGTSQGGETSGMYDSVPSAESLYHSVGSGIQGQQMQTASSSSSSSFPLRLQQSYSHAYSLSYPQSYPQAYATDAGTSSSNTFSNVATSSSIKAETSSGTESGQTMMGFSRPYRGSWDSNQPAGATDNSYAQDLHPPPATSQGLTSLSLYSQSGIGTTRIESEEAQPSPPPTSSSYSSHHSYAGHMGAHASLTAAASTSLETPYTGRSHSESLAHALDDTRKPSSSGSSYASTYHMPPPPAPANRWPSTQEHFDPTPSGTGVSSQSSTLLGRSDFGEGASQSMSSLGFHTHSDSMRPSQPAFWASAEAESSSIKREDSYEALSSRGKAASSDGGVDQQRRGEADVNGVSSRENGLERVVLTKPTV